MATTSDLSGDSDRLSRYSGSSEREFASQVVLRQLRHRCGPRIDPFGHQDNVWVGDWVPG